jgi:hypothetical protein
MDVLCRGQRPCGLISPFYLKTRNGRPPIGVERMLRLYFAEQWFNLSDPSKMRLALHWLMWLVDQRPALLMVPGIRGGARCGLPWLANTQSCALVISATRPHANATFCATWPLNSH